MPYSIQEAKVEADLKLCFPVMQLLRPHLDLEKFLSQVQRQQREQGYHLIFLKENDSEISSVMGFRLSEYLAWGKILYIDDLVTLPSYRRKGHAGLLLDWAKEQAKKENCDQVHLDSSHHRVEAHQCYAKHGFTNKGYHFNFILYQSD